MASASRPTVVPWSTIALLCAFAFVLLVNYAMVRPAIEAVFVTEVGTRHLPLAWLAVAAGSLAAVGLYNLAAARFSLGAVLGGAVGVTIAFLGVGFALAALSEQAAVYALYVWKDVHIVVLLEGLWSFAAVVFREDQAKWNYGLFLASGAAGSIGGNLVVTPLLGALGRLGVAVVVVLLFGLSLRLVAALHRATGQPRPPGAKNRPRWGDSLQLLVQSRHLRGMVALVFASQIVITLVDLRFQQVLELHLPSAAAITEHLGTTYAIVNGGAFVLNLATGFILSGVGVSRILIGVPLLLGGLVAAATAMPTLTVVTAMKVGSKLFDYSIYRSAKEILYLPLSYGEKTRGKAVVDMLSYRLGKGVASASSGAVLALGGGAFALGGTIVGAVGAWVGATVVLLQSHPTSTGPPTGDLAASDQKR